MCDVNELEETNAMLLLSSLVILIHSSCMRKVFCNWPTKHIHLKEVILFPVLQHYFSFSCVKTTIDVPMLNDDLKYSKFSILL